MLGCNISDNTIMISAGKPTVEEQPGRSLPLSKASDHWEDRKLGTASLCSCCCYQRSAPQSLGSCPHSYCLHLRKPELTVAG